MLRILSWNIRQGGGSRIQKQVNALESEGPEIVILSEFRNNDSGSKIRLALLKAGYRYQNVSAALTNDNSAAIFSKLPCNQRLFPQSDEIFPHNVVCNDYDAFSVFGMYLPHKKKHKLFDFLLTEISQGKPAILAGDFNTGKNHIDQKGNSFWYEEKLFALEKQDYVDAFRHKHGSVQEYSWYSHQGNGYRYDHTYLHKSLLPILTDCVYLHDWREQGLSDHSPMLLSLG